MIPIGSRVHVSLGGRTHSGTVALHGVSKAGERRILVWLGDGLTGTYVWFGLEAVRS